MATLQNKRNGTILQNIWCSRHHYFLLLPFLLLFSIFTVLPIAMSLFVGFTSYDMLNPIRFVGFDNYVRIFMEDNIFMIALKNTLVLAVAIGPVGYMISFFMAWLINDLGPRLRTVFTVLFYVPSLCGGAFMVWNLIFSPDRYGIINGALVNLKIIDQPINWTIDARYMLLITIIVSLWMSLGTGFLAFIAGLQNTDRSLFEAGALDGVRNRFQELWYITLPQMGPQLLFGAVMQIVSAFSVGAVPQTLFGYPSTEYAAETIVTLIGDYGGNRMEMGYASAMSTLLVLLMLLAKKLVNKFIARIGH